MTYLCSLNRALLAQVMQGMIFSQILGVCGVGSQIMYGGGSMMAIL